jgi:hypothetical protein
LKNFKEHKTYFLERCADHYGVSICYVRFYDVGTIVRYILKESKDRESYDLTRMRGSGSSRRPGSSSPGGCAWWAAGGGVGGNDEFLDGHVFAFV